MAAILIGQSASDESAGAAVEDFGFAPADMGGNFALNRRAA
jgi:hypothetical protein